MFRDLLAMRNHISATLEINASAYALAKLGARRRRSIARNAW